MIDVAFDFIWKRSSFAAAASRWLPPPPAPRRLLLLAPQGCSVGSRVALTCNHAGNPLEMAAAAAVTSAALGDDQRGGGRGHPGRGWGHVQPKDFPSGAADE